MQWNVDSKIITGNRHRESGLSSQDSTAFNSLGDKQAISLVDAIGKTEKSAEHGSTTAKFLTDFMLKNFGKIQSSDKKCIAYNLMVQIERLLYRKSEEYQVDKKELSSTLLGIVIDTKTQKYCLIHLGDGVIAAKGKDDKLYLLSKPCNGKTFFETPLTTSEDALKYVKIQKGCLKDVSGFLLASDGIYQNNFDLSKLKELFRRDSVHVILNKKEDDQSYIKIVCS